MYISFLDSIPWPEVGISVAQTLLLYWFVLLGLKLAGRRVFSELGPQELVVLLLVAESANMGLVHEDAGFWGTIFSVAAIITTGAVVERIPPLRKFLDDHAVVIFENGELKRDVMDKYLVDEDAMEETAREYGLASYRDFSTVYVEGNGKLTGIIKMGALTHRIVGQSSL